MVARPACGDAVEARLLVPTAQHRVSVRAHRARGLHDNGHNRLALGQRVAVLRGVCGDAASARAVIKGWVGGRPTLRPTKGIAADAVFGVAKRVAVANGGRGLLGAAVQVGNVRGVATDLYHEVTPLRARALEHDVGDVGAVDVAQALQRTSSR